MGIANLLPGIRELRAPLAAGYIWLLVGWLLLHDRIPGDGDAPVVSDLYDLADIVGRVGVAAAASLAAYLIGSLSTWASDLLPPAPLPEEHVDVEVHSWLGEPRMTPRTRISTAGHLALERVVFDAFNKISAADPNPKRIHEILSGERVGLSIFRSYQAKRLSRTTAAIVSAGVAAAASAIPFVGAAGTAVSGAGDLSRAWAEAEASLRDSVSRSASHPNPSCFR